MDVGAFEQVDKRTCSMQMQAYQAFASTDAFKFEHMCFSVLNHQVRRKDAHILTCLMFAAALGIALQPESHKI